MIVLPTNRKPRFFRSLLSASDSGDVAGTSPSFLNRFWMGSPSTKPQMYLLKLPNSSCTSINACALVTADSTLRRFLTMAGLPSSDSMRFFVKRATFWTSKSAKALR